MARNDAISAHANQPTLVSGLPASRTPGSHACRFVDCPAQRLLSRAASGQAVPRNDDLSGLWLNLNLRMTLLKRKNSTTWFTGVNEIFFRCAIAK